MKFMKLMVGNLPRSFLIMLESLKRTPSTQNKGWLWGVRRKNERELSSIKVKGTVNYLTNHSYL
jgi:hypothetical protein